MPIYYHFSIVHNTRHCRATIQPPCVTSTVRKSNLGKRNNEFLVLTPSLWTSRKETVAVLYQNLNLSATPRHVAPPLFPKYIVNRKVDSMTDAVHTEKQIAFFIKFQMEFARNVFVQASP